MNATVRVELPAHLCSLAGVAREVRVSVEGAVTQRSVLDALERAHPKLEGTIRDHGSRMRRPFIRFFADGEDVSHWTLDQELPQAVAAGTTPLLVIGAIAGG